MMEKIDKILQDLIGLPLTHTTRAANMECLKFGTVYRIEKDGEKYNIGEFALHLQCPWRLTNEKEIIVGSSDLYQRADESTKYEDDYDYLKFNANLRDVKLDKFINDKSIKVISAKADKFGGLEICFDNNTILTTFPDLASKADNEIWRLIDFRNENSKHLESWTTGYETNE